MTKNEYLLLLLVLLFHIFKWKLDIFPQNITPRIIFLPLPSLALSSLTILATSPDIDFHQVGCLAPLGGALVSSQRMSPSHLQARTTTVFTLLEELRGEKAWDRVQGGLRLPVPPGTAVMMPKAPSVVPCMNWTFPLPWLNLPQSTSGITKECILLFGYTKVRFSLIYFYLFVS